MESTAQYWRTVWLELEPHMLLHLAHAFSNRAPRGRKHDFKDAERLVRRLFADELILGFVPKGSHFQVVFRRLLPRLGPMSNSVESPLLRLRLQAWG